MCLLDVKKEEVSCNKCQNYDGCWILDNYREAKEKLIKMGYTMITMDEDIPKTCHCKNKEIVSPDDYKPKWIYSIPVRL